MTELLRGFDAFTMAFMVAVLYLSLSAVLVYTALCRRTYSGFGSMALAQVSWSVGLFLNYFRPFETLFSLYLGALLMQLYGVLLFRGLLRYGGVSPTVRLPANYIVFAVVSAVQAYYMFVDFNTCARVVAFSSGMAFFFLRIAIEPYVTRTWKRHATQSVFSLLFFFAWVGICCARL